MHSRGGSLSGAAAASESGGSGFELDFGESDDDASCRSASATPHARGSAPPRGALRHQRSGGGERLSGAGLSRVNAEMELLRAEVAHLQALWRDAQALPPAPAPAPLARAPARARSTSPGSARGGGSPSAHAHADAATSVSPPRSPRHAPPATPVAAADVRLPAAAREAVHAPAPAALPAQTPAATPAAQTPAAASIRLLGAELAAAAPPLATPAATPRVLDMRVPSLQKHRPAGDAAGSTLRLLQRPASAAATTVGRSHVASAFDVARAPGAPPVTLLSAEALHIKDSFDAAVAATEARLRAALGEALRESTNLRLARAPQQQQQQPQQPHTHAEAAAAAARRDARLARANAADAAGDSGGGDAHAYTAASAHAHTHAHAHAAPEPEDGAACRARAELEDPFVPLWQWAGGRPARLADLYRDAEPSGSGDAGLPRSALSRLVTALAPAADARALRFVAVVLDADGAADVVPLASFVHAVREGAAAGAASRAHFHAALHDTLSSLRRSMEAQPEAWSFQFRCAEAGALSLSQLLAAAVACAPWLSARQRVLLAAHAYAEGAYGGPRTRFTLQQAMRLCVPRAERSSDSDARDAPRRVPPSALAHARAHPPPALTVEVPMPPMPPQPPSAANAAASARAHLARRKRAQAEAAATAALAAAAAAAAATSVVRVELRRVHAAQQAQAAAVPAMIMPFAEDDDVAVAAAAEASLADLQSYTLPPPQPHATERDSPPRAAQAAHADAAAAPEGEACWEGGAAAQRSAAHAVDVARAMAGWRDDDAAAATQGTHPAPPPPPQAAGAAAAAAPHDAPAASAARAQAEREAGAGAARARARAMLHDARAALQAVAADADALQGDIKSEMRMVSQARVQLRSRGGGGAQSRPSPPPSARRGR
jgi:hypothetical protein